MGSNKKMNNYKSSSPFLCDGFIFCLKQGLPPTAYWGIEIVFNAQSPHVKQTMLFKLLHKFWVFLLHLIIHKMAKNDRRLAATRRLHFTVEKQLRRIYRRLPMHPKINK